MISKAYPWLCIVVGLVALIDGIGMGDRLLAIGGAFVAVFGVHEVTFND